MSGIHNEILKHLQGKLQKALIDDIPAGDKTKAGVVMLWPLQGDPEPDKARIAVTLHENDPEVMLGKEVGGERSSWDDEIEEIEIGGSATWRRRFTVKARCLYDVTQENLADARDITSTVRDRIERVLYSTSFSGVQVPNEYVSNGYLQDSIHGEMVQGGGPGSYDFYVKIRFEVLTTTKVG